MEDKIIIERMEAQDFLEMLREARDELQKRNYDQSVYRNLIRNIMNDFEDLCNDALASEEEEAE